MSERKMQKVVRNKALFGHVVNFEVVLAFILGFSYTNKN